VKRLTRRAKAEACGNREPLRGRDQPYRLRHTLILVVLRQSCDRVPEHGSRLNPPRSAAAGPWKCRRNSPWARHVVSALPLIRFKPKAMAKSFPLGRWAWTRFSSAIVEGVVAEPGETPGARGFWTGRSISGLAGHPIRIDPDRRICSGAVRPLAATDIQFWRGAPVDPDGTWLSAASARSRSRRNSFMRARIRAKSSAARGWIIGSSRSLDLVLTAARSFGS
jgi:hypothetical protein